MVGDGGIAGPQMAHVAVDDLRAQHVIDGDVADLPQIIAVQILQRIHFAQLVVDDGHGVGVVCLGVVRVEIACPEHGGVAFAPDRAVVVVRHLLRDERVVPQHVEIRRAAGDVRIEIDEAPWRPRRGRAGRRRPILR